MTVAIVDDEFSAREVLKDLLHTCDRSIEVIVEVDNYEDAVKLLQTRVPDVLFLDIEIGAHTGFDVLDQLPNWAKSTLVFVTAHDGYALKAFRYAAVNYLMKPVELRDLQETLIRIRHQPAGMDRDIVAHLREQLEGLSHMGDKRKMVQIRGHKGTVLLPVEDILYMQSEGSYTRFFTVSGEVHIASKPLVHFQKALSYATNLVRVHKSYIANINHIRFISRKDEGMIYFNDHVCIPVTHYDLLSEHLGPTE